jgi:hypothetical protein
MELQIDACLPLWRILTWRILSTSECRVCRIDTPDGMGGSQYYFHGAMIFYERYRATRHGKHLRRVQEVPKGFDAIRGSW